MTGGCDKREAASLRWQKYGTGRKAQAKACGATQDRWPVRTTAALQSLKNVVSDAAANGLTVEHVQVSVEPGTRRQAHRGMVALTPT